MQKQKTFDRQKKQVRSAKMVPKCPRDLRPSQGQQLEQSRLGQSVPTTNVLNPLVVGVMGGMVVAPAAWAVYIAAALLTQNFGLSLLAGMSAIVVVSFVYLRIVSTSV